MVQRLRNFFRAEKRWNRFALTQWIYMKCVIHHHFHRSSLYLLHNYYIKRRTINRSSILASQLILLTAYNSVHAVHLHALLIFVKLALFFVNIVNAVFLAKPDKVTLSKSERTVPKSMTTWSSGGKHEDLLATFSYVIIKHKMWRCRLLLQLPQIGQIILSGV